MKIGLGAIRCGFNESVKLVGGKKKPQIYNAMLKAGMQFDTKSTISGTNVNQYLKEVGEIVGKKMKTVSPNDTFNYLTAHGANQIVDANGNEIIIFLEKVSHPVKEKLTGFINVVKSKI